MAGVLIVATTGALAQDAGELDGIVVIGSTPFRGGEVDADRYPANVQSADAEDIESGKPLNVNEFLNREFASIHVNDSVNNPYQPDLKYRGYTASPLLGLPQGLSVYQDGVRINEPFGDTVNFDLIPRAAIAELDLVPGANPLFGLNTLGGALNVRTKSGFTHPGLHAEAYGGDFGRYGGHVARGGSSGDDAWFLLAQGGAEDGWRDFSGSRLRQVFGKFSHLADRGELHFSVTAADNELRGNGALPRELAEAEGREAVFTYPDRTSPELLMLNLRGVTELDDDLSLAWGAYYRRSDIATFNGDGSEFAQCEADEEPAFSEDFLCREEIEKGEERQALVTDTEGEPAPFDEAVGIYGTRNTSSTEQNGYGASLQLRSPGLLSGELISGVAVDFAATGFRAAQEVARLNADRGTTGLGIFTADGATRLVSRNGNAGVFALHRLPLAEGVEWTLGARYNRTTIDMNDRTPAAAGGDDNSLEGSHTFKRLNLTTGLAWQVTPGITLFGSGGQSSRAPSPLELSCANPDAPCRLPNGFVDDPPLEQVVATHFEIGARARARDLSWRAALFSSTNHDDIIFQAVNMFESFFDNVGDTRRRGLELSVGWTPLSSLRLSADYTYLQAEFLDAFNVSSPHHPVRAEGQPAPRTQRVEPGDRIPLVPEHLYRLGLDWRASRRLTVGLDLRGNSDQVFRGDRSNTDPERIDGFAVLDARLEAAFTEGLSGFLKVSNLLDSDYETFGMYGEPGEVLQDEELGNDPRFIGPGAPRGMWAGVTLEL